MNTQPLVEAIDRLRDASMAFHGFMSLINHGEGLDGAELYFLLRPIEAEIDEAIKCIRATNLVS